MKLENKTLKVALNLGLILEKKNSRNRNLFRNF